MNSTAQFDLLFGALTVGHIKDAFFNDETWYGVFAPQLKPTDGKVAKRLLSFISFSTKWNERIRDGMSADPAEFDRFSDIIKSETWSTVTGAGTTNRIADAPVFFKGGEISWRTCKEKN